MPKFDFCPDLWERSSLIGRVKQSELVCCHCPLYLWQWQVWCCLRLGFCWAERRWPGGPSSISSSDRSAVIQLHTEKLDWHFLPHSHIPHAKSLSSPFELGGWAAVVCILRKGLWCMFTKLLSVRVAPKFTATIEVSYFSLNAALGAFQQTQFSSAGHDWIP